VGSVFTPGLLVEPCTEVVRVRELSVAGEILVKKGDQVKPNDIIGRADLQGDLYILRVAERLGIEAFEVINGLKVKEGDVVNRGDLICEHAGLFGLLKTRFYAPESGEIEFITAKTGHVALRMPSRPISIDAFIEGEVIEVTPGKAVSIRSSAAIIQGIFGVGGERKGGLLCLDVEPDQRLLDIDIPTDCAGRVLAGGMIPSLPALELASERGAVGFITGSIDDRTLAGYLGYDLGVAITGDEDLLMTVIITEGFGALPMSGRVRHLFKELDGMFASINGATQVRAGAIRPEVIIAGGNAHSKLSSEAEARLQSGLVVGGRIRIIRFPYFGEIAEITELPHAAEKIATGAKIRVLRARVDSSNEVVTVPRANVELI